MYKKILSLFVLFTLISSGNAVADISDFFWSFDDLNSGAVNSDAEGTFAPGTNGSLYLYYSTNGPANTDLSVGAFLDVMATSSDVIEFLPSSATYDFSVVAGSSAIDNRWLDDVGAGGQAGAGAYESVSALFIDEWRAFTVTGGSGIVESHNGSAPGGLLDVGYDAGVDAFLFGRVDFHVVGNLGDTVDISTVGGSGGIYNGATNLANVVSFGGATITVGVPEPSSGGLAAIGLLALATRRRR